MTDVGTWDPVDDNNNAAPPAGWPEGMMPSGVNNSARAMMGALRREHDRIVGQIGSAAGAITVPTINTATVNATTVATTTVLASGNIGAAGFQTRAGVPGPATTDVFNIQWIGGAAGAHLWVDNTDVGQIATLPLSSPLPLASGGTAGTTQAAAFANIATLAVSSGNPGYMEFPNGLKLQWGQTAGLAGANTIGVTFPIAFTTFVTVQVTVIGDLSAAGGVASPALSGFTATSSKATGGSIYWFAIGF